MDPDSLNRLARPASNCRRCGVALAQQAGKHPTAIVQGNLPPAGPADSQAAVAPPADDLHRLDLCAQCWPLERDRIRALRADNPEQADAPRVVGFWMTRRTPPKPKPARTRPSRAALLAWWDAKWASVAKAAVGGGADPASRPLFVRAHLAALILMRHGALRWTDTRRPEDDLAAPEILTFRRSATTVPVLVAAFVPDSEQELDALAAEVDADMHAFLESLETNGGDAPGPMATVA